jgi:hypothetical protein
MTNSEIREWYLRKVATIPDLDLEWTKNGDLLEARARRAWEIRHNARREARSMMENKAEVEALRRVRAGRASAATRAPAPKFGSAPARRSVSSP